MEAHLKLRPLDFAVNGIFLCGVAHSPKFIEESIAQAQGAAARAMGIHIHWIILTRCRRHRPVPGFFARTTGSGMTVRQGLSV
jgi:hypothetical protein